MEIGDITKEMFVAWKNDPVTAAVLASARNEREKVKEALANGAYGDKTNDMHKAIGYCIGIAQFDNIQFQEDLDDEDAASGMESVG